MQDELKKIEADALSELEAVANSPDLEGLRVKYFGRKGLLSTVMRGDGATLQGGASGHGQTGKRG